MDVDYIPEKLLEIYEKTTGDFDYLCDEQTKDFTLQIELTKDESAVFLNIVPPTVEEEPLTEERIFAALKEKGIYQGILDENIKKMIARITGQISSKRWGRKPKPVGDFGNPLQGMRSKGWQR